MLGLAEFSAVIGDDSVSRVLSEFGKSTGLDPVSRVSEQTVSIVRAEFWRVKGEIGVVRVLKFGDFEEWREKV